MANLFEELDFALFTQYQGKTQTEAPDGQTKLRNLYDKLGLILDGLQKLGYKTDINRNPLTQAGPSTMKYCSYHWSKIYPKDQSFYNGCVGKVFFVIGSTEKGIDIHIDSNSRKGYNSDSNKATKTIKDETWLQISPNEASQYSCDDYVKRVDRYIKECWKEFNLFGKEFNIFVCTEELNKMEMDNIKNLLLSNYNLILTGAPGTGKTYLAKEIANALGCDKDHIGFVQFHPSYDYTDFVEGLRPVKEGDTLGFQRKNGVFKEFCKKALMDMNTFEAGYQALVTLILDSPNQEYICSTYGSDNNQFNIYYENDEITFKRRDSDNKRTAFKERLLKLYNYYIGKGITDIKNVVRDEMESVVGCSIDYTNYRGILQTIIDQQENNQVTKPYVFIVDEINRGEISKIFGELFYSIDSGYRGIKGRVNTQYQNLVPDDDVFSKGFYIPENVYIIGTMNDIDRSVESMDFAMRRRFAWKEITAKSRQSMLDEDETWGSSGKPSEEVIAEMKTRMDNLNACIIDKYKIDEEELSPRDRIGLTEAYQIGAAYFLKYGMYGNFDDLWTNHLKGLLYEYLRGTTNIEIKIERLQDAYNDTTAH